jgi:crossover junction endodeoxyribonuclease RusA
VTLTLPYPPSANRYWRTVSGRILISREGRRYREIVCGLVRRGCVLRGRLCVTVQAHQPDLRRRDLDNLGQAVLDALEAAEVYDDDSQIDDLRFVRAGVDRKNPRVVVEVVEL